jgi:hypothetical protein
MCYGDGAVRRQVAFTTTLKVASLSDTFLPLGRVLRRVSLGSGAQVYGVRILLLALRRSGRGGRGGCGGAYLMGGSGLQA